MEDEQPVDAAPVDATPVDTTPAVDDSIHQPDAPETPLTPDFESMFADPAAPEVPPVDPNAPPTEIPEAFKEALGISEYVKEPAQVAQAVRAADEIWGIENGKIPAHQMLEGFRERNPEGFEQILRTNLIPYIEQITGQKLMDPNAAPAAEKSPEQQRIDAIEAQLQQRQQAERQQGIDREVTQARGIMNQKVDDALKGTYLEGKGQELIAQIAPHMGMNAEQATKALLSGNTAMVEKAVKTVLAQKEADARAYARWKIAEGKKLQTGLPAGKGNPRTGSPDLESMTREQKIQYLQEA